MIKYLLKKLNEPKLKTISHDHRSKQRSFDQSLVVNHINTLDQSMLRCLILSMDIDDPEDEMVAVMGVHQSHHDDPD